MIENLNRKRKEKQCEKGNYNAHKVKSTKILSTNLPQTELVILKSKVFYPQELTKYSEHFSSDSVNTNVTKGHACMHVVQVG